MNVEVRQIKTQEDWNMEQARLVQMARDVVQMPLVDMLNMFERADTLGPLLNPTTYRLANERMAQYRKLARALVEFREAALRSTVL